MTRFPRRTVAAIFAIALVATGTVPSAHAQNGPATISAETLTDEQVRAAIDAIVEELYRRKDPVRFWDPANPPSGRQPQDGGYTALVVLALLQAGESYQQPRLRDAIEHLESFEMSGVYAVAIRSSVWAALPGRFRTALARDAEHLLNGFSAKARGWDYSLNPNTTRQDNSIRQFGALGLWEAAKRGIPVPDSVWHALEAAYLDMQLADGGWNYDGHGPSTGSMTAAGLATLFITQDLLHADRAVNLGTLPEGRAHRGMKDALAWMNERFSPTENPGRDEYFFYYLYALERVALAGGYKYFGGRDWYREGAAEIIRRLCAWDPDAGTMTVHEREYGVERRSRLLIDEIAFGLMFLSRGRQPIAVNKLRDEKVVWNNRPRDVANFVQWLSDETATHLNWQITDISAPAEEWLDAPLLYVASDRPPLWQRDIAVNTAAYVQEHRAYEQRRVRGEATPREAPPPLPDVPELHRIRRYLERGGLLVAVNEGRDTAFAMAMEAMGSLMFPTLEWRNLPSDHWAFSVHQPVRTGRPRLRGLSNGVRDLIIIVADGDVPATLQARHTERTGHYSTLANLYFYASELNRTRSRLAALPGAAALLKPGTSRAVGRPVTVIHAMHAGAWNPEPGALRRFCERLEREGDLAVSIEARPLRELATIDPFPNVVLLQGLEAQSFTPAEREAMRSYAERGGLILVETPGGRGHFTAAAESSLATLFGAPPRPMLRHAVVTGRSIAHAVDLSECEYRPYSIDVVGAVETSPRLRGIDIDGELCVLFSRDDLTHALLDQPCWGIHGYAPESAAHLLRNILLYATRRTVGTD